MPRECLSTNSSTQAVSSDVAELKDIVRALLLDKKNQASAPAPAPAPVKAVELSCVTCGGAHSHQNCPATHDNVYRDNISEYVSQAAFRPQMVANHIRPPGFPPVQNSQANNANNFNRGNNFNQNRESNFNQNRGGNFNQSNFSQNQLHRPQVPQTHSVTKNDFDNYVKANDAIMRNMQNNLQNQDYLQLQPRWDIRPGNISSGIFLSLILLPGSILYVYYFANQSFLWNIL
ncbi:hypothetical protein Tco_1393681 [Tanacetum coccineum]